MKNTEIMRKTNKLLSILAVTAATISACSPEEKPLDSKPDTPVEKPKVTVTFVTTPDAKNWNPETTEPATRTVMGKDGKVINWKGGEKTTLFADLLFINNRNVKKEAVEEGRKLQITVSELEEGTGSIVGFLGVSNDQALQQGGLDNTPLQTYGIQLPSIQTMEHDTWDPTADCLILDEIQLEGKDLSQPITEVGYTRLHALTRLNMTNIAPEYKDFTTVEIESATENLAGSFSYDFKGMTYLDEQNQASEKIIFRNAASKKLTLNYEKACTPRDGKLKAWAVMAARTLEPTEELTITLKNADVAISKKFNLTKVLKNSDFNYINLDMTGAVVTPLKQSSYKLVKSQEDIAADGEYLLATEIYKIFDGKNESQFKTLDAPAVLGEDGVTTSVPAGSPVIRLIADPAHEGAFKMLIISQNQCISTTAAKEKCLSFAPEAEAISWTIKVNENAEIVFTGTKNYGTDAEPVYNGLFTLNDGVAFRASPSTAKVNVQDGKVTRRYPRLLKKI